MRHIKLADGRFALIDDEDYEDIGQYKWHIASRGYAVRMVRVDGKRKRVYMHRQIMKPVNGTHVDHINNNKLDNRRSNLRFCNTAQNRANAKPNSKSVSKYKGVSYRADRNKWVAAIKINNKSIHLGAFTSEIKAARQYDAAAKEHYGEFAYLNFGR